MIPVTEPRDEGDIALRRTLAQIGRHRRDKRRHDGCAVTFGEPLDLRHVLLRHVARQCAGLEREHTCIRLTAGIELLAREVDRQLDRLHPLETCLPERALRNSDLGFAQSLQIVGEVVILERRGRQDGGWIAIGLRRECTPEVAQFVHVHRHGLNVGDHVVERDRETVARRRPMAQRDAHDFAMVHLERAEAHAAMKLGVRAFLFLAR